MAASAQSCLSDCSESSESDSLLQQYNAVQQSDVRKKYSSSGSFKYRLPVIRDKGAIILIVWNFFFAVSLFSCLKYREITYTNVLITVASVAVLYPLLGWLADCKFGKFNVLRAASYLLLTAAILKNVGIFIFPSKSAYFSYPSVLIWSVAAACYLSCIIPLITDQSVGASAEELSFTVHWVLWGCSSGYGIATLTWLLSGVYQEFSQFFLTLSSFIVALVSLDSCHHFVMTKPVISNDMRLIAQVLNYARKHKYPERRSALTYWEEDYPSRLDIGKDKYGGPFTFEQVENVKTVLRLIPLVACVNIFHVEFWQKSHLMSYYSNCSSIYINFFLVVSDYPPFFSSLIAFIGLPIYYFIVFPLIQKHVLTIIRRIGLGIFTLTVSFFASAIVESVQVIHSELSANTSFIFDNYTADNCPSSYNILWITAPELLKALGGIITAFGMYELIIAQTPQQSKGLLLSMCTGIGGVFTVASFSLNKLLNISVCLLPSCLFYYYISYFTLGTLAFILYVLVAKWYKLRIRDDIIPYHMIAEEHFEREQTNRCAYLRSLECGTEEHWKQ